MVQDSFDIIEENLLAELEYVKKAKKLKETIFPDLKPLYSKNFYIISEYANKICNDVYVIKYASDVVVRPYIIFDSIRVNSCPHEFIVADIEDCEVFIRDDWEEEMIRASISSFIIDIVKDYLREYINVWQQKLER